MNKSFTPEGVQFAFDATSLSAVQKCLRYYQYKHIEGWHPHHFSDHLRFGAHFATALEHYYKHLEAGLSDHDATIEVVWEALRDTWDRPQCKHCKEGLVFMQDSNEWYPCEFCSGTGVLEGAPWVSLDGLKNRENLIRSIVWYLDHFKDDPTPVLKLSDGAPAVELSFSLPVDDGIVFSGHIDRLVEYGGDPYVMDQKTTKTTVGPYYFDQYKPHTQMSMYTFAGRAIYGVPVKGVIIDATQVAVGFSRFERGFTMRTEDELNEWYENSMYWVAQAQNAVRDNYFPMNAASCYNFGGCEFRKVCSRPASLRKQFLAADFTQKPTWDPLEKR